jgi:hypothetical protein
MRNVIVGLIVAGLVFLVGGFAVGGGEVSTWTGGKTISCGSAWSPDYTAADERTGVDQLSTAMSGGGVVDTSTHRAACVAAFGARSGLGVMMLLIAAASGIAAAVVFSRNRETVSTSSDQVQG